MVSRRTEGRAARAVLWQSRQVIGPFTVLRGEVAKRW
jgi:hypothetical protein